ncbi:TetR/AcrR family transcriptional regulator [Gephyromycinifex aptenodytis]|uniref:TetR/AcrR family transcriptional regulator n=1 Tax=Gephyromycinifex aptenodytis TaxID=2716227 RepID=UPI001445EA21|nr:TetR/AcrR family transcriptional regulator [Gephyromycinifex aptenodytis]
MSSTRDRIIDALQEVLAQDGPEGATLEAVAAAAGISKGGLLYHFKSKEALFNGLLERLRELGALDVQRCRASHDGPVAAYLRSSSVVGDEYTSTVLAALRLTGTRALDVESAVSASLDSWGPMLLEAVGDPVLARLVQLVGDGLYLHALFGEEATALDRQVISRLVEQAATAAG